MLLLVVQDITRLGSRESRFDIHNGPRRARILGVPDCARDAMGAAVLCFSNVFEWPKIERNLHAEINPALAYGHANTVKAEVAIFFAVPLPRPLSRPTISLVGAR